MSILATRQRSGRRTGPTAPEPPGSTAPAGPTDPAGGAGSPQLADIAGEARVNLLSPWVLERVRADRLRKQLVYAVVALVVLVGMAWGAQQLRLSEARAELSGEQAVGEGLDRRIASLAPVEAYVSAVRAKATTVGTAMHTEIEFSRALATLRATLPAGVRLADVALTMPVAGEDPAGAGAATTGAAPSAEQLAAGRGIVAACPGPDPFHTRTIVGCVTVSGTAPSRATVATMVRRLAGQGLFVEPFISTTTTAVDAPVTFSGSVGLSPRVFSGRYDELLTVLEQGADQ